MLMNVGHKDPSLFRSRKRIGLINTGTSMSRPVTMICNGFYVVVNVWIKMLATLPVIDTAGHHMPHMGYNTGRDKQLSLGVIIDTPWVAKTMSNYLKLIFCRMIAPNATINFCAFSFKNIFGKRVFMPV